MNAPKLGLVEGFFGPAWSWVARQHMVRVLGLNRGDFYFYAPKRDRFLRKSWSENHPTAEWNELKLLRDICRESRVQFGLGLSPFEIHENWSTNTKELLKNKIYKLEELDFDILGLFFDDMKGSPDLAEKQIEIVAFVQNQTKKKILFCPTYYSFDPILDKVFGERPAQYLDLIGSHISADVDVLWTGQKVISPTITENDLQEVAKILKRKPFVWDNFFANDGPKQCKFLNLKSLTGRNHNAFLSSAGWAFNLMNQPFLSLALFLASTQLLINEVNGDEAFDTALLSQYGDEFGKMITHHRDVFTQVGLDRIDKNLKEQLITEFSQLSDKKNAAAYEIVKWLQGDYIVGAECLTD